MIFCFWYSFLLTKICLSSEDIFDLNSASALDSYDIFNGSTEPFAKTLSVKFTGSGVVLLVVVVVLERFYLQMDLSVVVVVC